MADEHARGVRDYSASLWSLLMFEAFLRNNEASATVE
jgi:asparagine synthase (glutamine-hydrolysing)